MLPNIFTLEIVDNLKTRINKLHAKSDPKWGMMNVGQMLAHCNVTYEMIYTNIHPKPNFFMKLILKSFVKKGVVNEVPYAKNLKTAPQFIIKEQKDFDVEKKRLFDYLDKTMELGESHFDGKASHSFGSLSTAEWNNMMYKHLDHHLTQFGV
ncbi:MAG: hypothetical protein RLZZ546_308 [Bacteroidota bacterium]|jgi:methylglyoxal synthase